MTSATITRLMGVYDADGTLRGEIAYFVGARLGRAHCSLCDITHGPFRKKAAWRACAADMPVPFDTYHRNDQPASVRSATGDTAPVVVAETSDDIVVLLGPSELDTCEGSVEAFVAALDAAVDAHELRWPLV